MNGPVSHSRNRTAAGLPPITATKIIDAAVELTREQGLEGWSIRQLAGALGAHSGVVYHHVGDRGTVADAVVDRVISVMPLPSAELPWREWFSELLLEGRPVLRRHRGVARRLVLVGPTVPSALPTIDRGVQVLQRAGFDRDATLVYRYLLNSAFMLVAVEDDRQDLPGAAAGSMVELFSAHEVDPGKPGLAAAREDVLDRAAASRTPEQIASDFYEYTVARALDGAAALLTSA
jgi:AcrR family transcriptional regulator